MKKLAILASITLVLMPILVVADNEALENKKKVTSQPNAATTKSGGVKQTGAGLRSDGELVQTKKKLNLIGHELSHTQQQQGRMSTSADWNQASKATKKQKHEFREHVTFDYQKVSASKNKKRKGAMVNLKQQRFVKPVQIRQPLESRCNPLKFPKNAIVKQSGKQHKVECTKGKIRISDAPQTGVRPIDRKKLPKKKIKNSDLSDEMPEDLPAG